MAREKILWHFKDPESSELILMKKFCADRNENLKKGCILVVEECSLIHDNQHQEHSFNFWSNFLMQIASGQ